MNKVRPYLFLLIAVCLFAAGCGFKQYSSNPPQYVVFPENNSTGLAVRLKISATFDRDMDPQTINDSSLTLISQAGAVPGAVSYEANNRTATFTPRADLAFATRYTANLSEAIKSNNGDSIAPFSWEFTTGTVNQSAAGTLDATFDGDGILEIGQSNIYSLALDSLGRILVVGSGSSANLAHLQLGDRGMAVWRYKDDGTADSSFGDNGIVVVYGSAGSAESHDDVGYSLAIDPAGKIYVTGTARNSQDNTAMVIWRLNSDGTLDTSFGGYGIVVFDGSDSATIESEGGASISVGTDGKIMVAGGGSTGPYPYDPQRNSEWKAIWRYNADGSPDPGFTDGSHVGYIIIPTASANLNASSAILDGEGKLLVAGSSPAGSMALWRIKPNGSFDETFGSSGRAVDVREGKGNAIALDPLGNIYVTGTALETLAMAIWKFDASGNRDNGFGEFGRAVYGAYNTSGLSILVEPSGEILVTGKKPNNLVLVRNPTDMVVWRYNPGGSTDESFGINGLVAYNFGVIDEQVFGSKILTDYFGRILVCGGAFAEGSFISSNRSLIWRYK
jgi:uncharacterized delta-60 repeat protein